MTYVFRKGGYRLRLAPDNGIRTGGDCGVESIRDYTNKQLRALAKRLRRRIIASVRENGGHLASSLGVVDLIVALHKVFDFEKDKIVFDVGHQAYAHKLLTGRNLDGLRTKGGVSGFTDPSESPYDAFVSGHSGNSIAASIGLCNARDARGGDEKVICVIGDASLGNGLALEAVFSSEKKPENLIVVLNDNGMSISRDNSAYRAISRVTAKKGYRTVNSMLGKMFRADKAFGRTLRRFKYNLKGWLNKNSFFDLCGFKYIGPVNGHDIGEMTSALEDVKKLTRPVLLHVMTVKGKGYEEAERDPSFYHGVGACFTAGENSFAESLGTLLDSEAERDPGLVAVTAAMRDGVGLAAFSEKHPDRFYDVGICEEYAVTMAAGMAEGGLSPVVCIYSTFLQRAYDQIVHDVCIRNLPVLFCADRAGLVGSDGKTHQGLPGLSALRSVPNLAVYAPKDPDELADLFRFARTKKSPAVLFYPNGKAPRIPGNTLVSDNALWEILSPGEGTVVLACGARSVSRALRAKELTGTDAEIVNCRTVSPLDGTYLASVSSRRIITFEEGYAAGGFGSAVAEWYAARGISVRIRILGIPSVFVSHATAEEQAEECGVTAEALAAILTE